MEGDLGDTRLLIVSPVRNEAAHIERVAHAVAAQSRPPDLWIVVDDGSDDETAPTLRRLAREISFMRLIETPRERADDARTADRLALAAAPRSFNRGLAQVDWQGFSFIGKLDGDIELPADYFEQLLARCQADPALGIAGGRLVELHGSGWRSVRIPDYHVHGALKLYSRECFRAIGGVDERLGWDTIDETYARLKGFSTSSFPDLVARHHRHWGSADGRLRGRARHGECAYIVRYGLPWVLLRSLKVALARPVGLSGLAFLFGYSRAAARRAPKVEDPEFKRLVRRELRRRILAALVPTTPRVQFARKVWGTGPSSRGP